MYDPKTQQLIENPINRYLLNSEMLPNMKKNSDGSLTLIIQKDSPGKAKEANWLPAPNGPILYASAPLHSDGDATIDLAHRWGKLETASGDASSVRSREVGLPFKFPKTSAVSTGRCNTIWYEFIF
jgi:hypothetical protein